MDNLLTSVNTIVEALQIFEALTEKLASVSFNLRDWTSNSEQFQNSIPLEKRSSKTQVSVLDLLWDIQEDILHYQFEEGSSANSLCTTLSCLQQVFDPLGYVSPCLLDLKLFIQECWKSKILWDQVLPDHMQIKLCRLMSEREEILKIIIPRYFWHQKAANGSSFELHAFCDASIKAYGCVVYLVRKPKSGVPECTLLFAKNRVAPLKSGKLTDNSLSIPRLELLAVLIGKRASQFILTHMNISTDTTVLWTDSTTVL